ncbi:restriction endonuclease subunit S [Deinococcus arenae]|nr:restriction endonuclease subunit S [Deinococcus arenae]
MASDWKIVNLGEILTLQRGHDLPSQKRLSGSVPVISSSGITDYHNEPAAQGPGVITGRYGTIGEVFYSEADYWPLNTTLYVKDFKGNNPKYIYYLLKTIDFHQFNDKSSVPGVNRNHAHLAMVKVADTRTQNRIAEILSSLDDKIALNRQMNRTLEQMARALFKSWFIDFDPVHAKQRGEQPAGMDAETAALFPDRFVEIDGKEVPEGWDYCKASEIAVIKIGKTPPRNEPEWFSQERGGEVWISIRDMGRPGIFISDSSEYLTRESVDRFNINMAPVGSVLLSFKLTLGRVKIVTKNSYTNEAIAQFNFPRESYSHYFYFLLLSYDYSALGSTSSIATAVNSKIIRDMPILRPSASIIDAFSVAIENIMGLSRIKEEEINHLEQMRDSLLPRLLSGELDVSDWENAVEVPQGAPA